MQEEEMFRKNDCGDDQEVEADRPEEAAGAEDDSGSDERPGPRVRVHGAGDLWGILCTGGAGGHSPNLSFVLVLQCSS